MGSTEFEQIARELLDLLDQQVAAIVGRNFNDLTTDEVNAYQCRKRRILESARRSTSSSRRSRTNGLYWPFFLAGLWLRAGFRRSLCPSPAASSHSARN